MICNFIIFWIIRAILFFDPKVGVRDMYQIENLPIRGIVSSIKIEKYDSYTYGQCFYVSRFNTGILIHYFRFESISIT